MIASFVFSKAGDGSNLSSHRRSSCARMIVPVAALLLEAILLLSLIAVAVASASSSSSSSNSSPNTKTQREQRPNILFLIDESTDGRTYRPSFEAIDLINIRRLFAPDAGRNNRDSSSTTTGPSSSASKARPTTVQFDTHYVTAPVCAASRASIWSGKYPHRIPHLQASTQMPVRGAWNNFEGLPRDYPDKIHQVLERAAGYTTKISGKTDWVTGGHSLDNRVSAWTMYTNFPYNTTDDQAGFYNEYGMCTGEGVITPTDTPKKGGYYSGDWKAVNETTAWIVQRGKEQALAREQGKAFQPFFAYQGMNIVHPQYFTSKYWYQKVNHSAVRVPVWTRLENLHPCDYQATMLKGCLPRNASEAQQVYSPQRRKRIRAIYYAMILEFDSMVGAYLDALQAVDGLVENTVVILTSDHGDMQMEHQQFYKMVPYDASSRVPLIIKIPSGTRVESGDSDHDKNDGDGSDNDDPAVEVNPFVTQPTSHVDLFPTIMDLAGVPDSERPEDLHGESLLPFLVPSKTVTDAKSSFSSSRNLQNATEETNSTTTSAIPRKRNFAVNQFHGNSIGMSWFSVIDENQYKYNVFGTGDQHVPQLFDLIADPGERTNLAIRSDYGPVLERLDGLLRSVVDYPEVALDVARYTHTSLGAWVKATSDWKTIVQNLRWSDSFGIDANASIRAIEAYLEGPPKVNECRSDPVWPPLPPSATMTTTTR